jgi:hypothetical protein
MRATAVKWKLVSAKQCAFRFARFQKTKLQTNESKQVMKNVCFICSSFMYVFTMVASKDDDSAVTLAAEDVV